MSIDVDALLQASVSKHEKCQTCIWLASRPDDEREKWEDAIGQPRTFSSSQISRAMAKVARMDDFPPVPATGSVLNHRNGHARGRTA